MKRLQAFKFEMMPNGGSVRLMRQFAGCRRVVFNKGLATQREYYAQNGKKIPFFALCAELKKWKAESSYAWLNSAPSQVLQQALKDLEQAYSNFFAKRADFPAFKKKGQGDRFRFPQGFKLDQLNSRIFLPKMGWIRYRNSRKILGTPKNVTVSQSGGKWYVSIQTERDVEQPVHPATSAVGIDLGIARFATLSDGTVIAPLNSFKKNQLRLVRAQRAMSRKQKFSRNWIKAKAKVQKIHSTIANVRRDFLHKTSTAICKNHALVVMEDLKVANMSRSAKGSKEAPGTNVKAKSGLNRSILDQGWYEFRRQLTYKEDWLGGMVLAVPPQRTSQRCACCGYVDPKSRISQDRFVCTACAHEANADDNASNNILAAGHAVLARGEPVQSGRSAKQEPAEVTMHEVAHA